jgi:hypothetical protein
MKDQPPLAFSVTPPVGLGRLQFQVQEWRQLPFDVYLQRLQVEGGVLTEVPRVLLLRRMLVHTNMPAERDVEIRGPF